MKCLPGLFDRVIVPKKRSIGTEHFVQFRSAWICAELIYKLLQNRFGFVFPTNFRKRFHGSDIHINLPRGVIVIGLEVIKIFCRFFPFFSTRILGDQLSVGVAGNLLVAAFCFFPHAISLDVAGDNFIKVFFLT